MVGVVDTAAVAVERPGILTLLKAAIKIWRQTEAGVDALALQLLRDHWSYSSPEPPNTDDVERQASALGVDPEAGTVLLPALPAKHGLTLLGVEFQRVVLCQEVLY